MWINKKLMRDSVVVYRNKCTWVLYLNSGSLLFIFNKVSEIFSAFSFNSCKIFGYFYFDKLKENQEV